MLPKMELCKSWNPQKHLYKWGYHKIHLEIKMHTPKDLPPENHKWRFLSRGWAKDTQPAMFIYCHVRLLGLLKQFPYCWWFRNSKANYLTCMKRLKSRDIYHINWRRISSINSARCSISTRWNPGLPHGTPVVPAAVCKSKAPTVDSEAKGITCSANHHEMVTKNLRIWHSCWWVPNPANHRLDDDDLPFFYRVWDTSQVVVWDFCPSTVDTKHGSLC